MAQLLTPTVPRVFLRPSLWRVAGLVCACLLFSAGAADGQTVVRSVSQSSDDAEQDLSDNSMYLNSSDLEIDTDDWDYLGPQYVGMRFQNITVPVGATITSAQIQFHVDEVWSNVAVTVTFSGEDVDDAATFTSSTNNLGGRPETTATVDWAVPHWANISDEGAAQLSADLSTIVQEIVDRGGWASGNDIVILIKSKSGSGYRTAESYDGESASAPEITITYSTDSTPPSAPVITQPTTPTSDSTPVISGTASEDGGTITLTSDLDGTLSPTGTVTGGAWSITLTSALSLGTHSLSATHTDAATNESSASGAKSIQITEGTAHDRRLWTVFLYDHTDAGTPGITSWGQDDIIEFSDGDLKFEPTDTDGTFSFVASLDGHFDDGDVNLYAIHYVTTDLTVGGGANTFDLERGDVLFSMADDESIGADNFDDRDIHVFRPTTSGDYSSGTFYHLLDDMSSGDTYGLTLVEYDTYVGDQQLYAGDFLFIDSGASQEITHYAPTGVGIGTTSGTTSEFISGTGPFNVGQILDGLELVEVTTTFGGVTLVSGTLLVTSNATDTVGDNSLSVEDEDIFRLTVSTTYMGSSSSSATATMFMDASEVGLSVTEEDIFGIAIWEPDPQAFRSKGTGNWSAPTSWERYTGSAWVDSGNFPWFNPADAITVQSGHTITVDSGVGTLLNLDQTTVASGGTMVVDQKTVVLDGSGTDFTVAGQLTVNASKEFNPSGASTMSVSSGGTVTNSGTFNASGTSAVTFTSGSTYQHSQDGGNFPATARTTWNSGSTAEVTGVTSSVPSELGASFHHFTWNSTGQTGAIVLSGTPSIAGDLTVTSTGSSTLTWGSGDDLTVANFAQTGGTFTFSAAGGTMTATNVSVTGGAFTVGGGSGAPVLDINGNLTVSGGGVLDEFGAGSVSITFTGGSTQSVTAASGLAEDVDLVVNNTGGIQLLSALDAPRHLTGTSGTIDLNSNDLSVGGDLTVNSDLTNAASVTFDGLAAQQVSYSPGTLSVPTFVVDKSSGTLTLATALTVTTTGSVRNGTLDVNGNTVTFGHGTTLYNAGTVTGNVTMERAYSEDTDGWRMIATPVDGINYSSLNTSFHTQGAAWADLSGGTATLQAPDFASQDWTPLNGADAAFAAAQGYIFFMYKELHGNSILPATWSVTGSVRTNSNASLSWNTVSTDSYNLIGNRTTSKIDWDAAVAASTNVATTYSTWDPALTSGGGLTGYKYYNSSTGIGLAGRYIAPFTAFMVEPSASGATLVFSTSEAANLESASYFGKRNGISPHIRIAVEGEGHADLESYVVFEDDAEIGEDGFDAWRMQPLSPDFVTMVSLEGERRLAYDVRSMVEGRQEYALGMAATRPGAYTLSWPDWHKVPDDWTVMLRDEAEGRLIDLRLESEYRFRVTPAQTTENPAAGIALMDIPKRFTLVVAKAGGPVPEPETASTSDTAILAQNYPNPFNPTTSIRYSVPESAAVRLDVYDMLGRSVATLVDRVDDAGWKEVTWDAGSLPSGLYLYRLTMGRTTLTRSMILQR